MKVGDEVMIECTSGMGSGGPDKITKITTKYDEDTGKPYKVIWCGNHGFHAGHKRAITPPLAYYIYAIKRKRR